MTDLGSRSDMVALQRSGRSKTLLLGGVLVAALGAAAWAFFVHKEGIGNPEDPTKVLVVSKGRVSQAGAVLRRGGFTAESATLESWEHKAEEQAADVLDGRDGVEAVLTLADEFGYGYVAFENPSAFDFEGIEFQADRPAFDEHVRFAVVSVGDFAFPHRMTVNPVPSPVMKDSGVVLLQALFEQPELAAVLPENDDPSVEEIQLRDRLRDALDRLARIPQAESFIDKVKGDLAQVTGDDERAEPRPELIGGPFESGSPHPLASGELLTVSRDFALRTRDAIRVDLDIDDAFAFRYGSAGGEADARQTCSALLGGQVDRYDDPELTFAAHGDALVVRRLSRGAVLWRLEPGKTGCAFKELGPLEPPLPGLDDAVVPHASGRVARWGVTGGRAVVSVIEAGNPDERVLLGMFDGVSVGEPSWWTDDVLVARATELAIDRDSLVFMRVSDPTRVLVLDASVFEGASSIAQVAVDRSGKQLVATVGPTRSLCRLDLPGEVASLFSDGSSDADEPSDSPSDEGAALSSVVIERDGLPTIVRLDSNRFVATRLPHPGRAYDPVVSPDGAWVAAGLVDDALDPDAPGDTEIAAIAMDGSATRVLTRNDVRDHSPSFTADGRHVVFETRVEVPRSSWVITLPRRARL